MIDIRDYINLSKTATLIGKTYSIPNEFKDYYKSIGNNEKKSLIHHFIVNNIPFAFKEKPILFEQIKQYFADKLQINPNEIKLIGSAKTGFSISPLPAYGRAFGEHSDLDFSIINNGLFCKLEGEFNEWANLYKTKKIRAINLTEEHYWSQNIETGYSHLNKGFFDTHFIPNREQFPTTRRINNSLWLIKMHLEEKHSIKVKKASASIYKEWNSFAGRLNRNTDYVMKNV